MTLGVAAGTAVAEVATGLEMGWAVAGSALADGVGLETIPTDPHADRPEGFEAHPPH